MASFTRTNPVTGQVASEAEAMQAGEMAAVAAKADAYSWPQLVGAGCLAGIGFTMSLFIAGQAFPGTGDFAAAKVAVFAASALSALLGVAVLWRAGEVT